MKFLFASLAAFAGLAAAAQTKTVNLLDTKDEGPWPCYYYFVNDNSDIAAAEAGHWAALTEDESDWAEGFGPFSSENDTFLHTPWAGSIRPLLIRRHFTLTPEQLDAIKTSVTRIKCSYDENPKMYLNGTLVWSASGWNESNYVESTLSSARKKLLVEGDNVLAVSLTTGGGSGHIDYGIYYVDRGTAIDGVEADETYSDGQYLIYNLSGQQLDTLQRGVNIVSGKKLLTK